MSNPKISVTTEGQADSNRGLTPPARSDLPTGLYDTDNTTASQTLNTTHTV